MSVICCKYCKKYMTNSSQETFNFFRQFYGHARLNFSISVIDFKYMQGIL